MDDLREKVIKGIENCIKRMTTTGECGYGCPYYHNPHGCKVVMLNDAISSMKAQEPVLPKVDIDTYVCGACGTRLERQSLIGPNAILAETFNYCPNCGRKVKWDD